MSLLPVPPAVLDSSVFRDGKNIPLRAVVPATPPTSSCLSYIGLLTASSFGVFDGTLLFMVFYLFNIFGLIALFYCLPLFLYKVILYDRVSVFLNTIDFRLFFLERYDIIYLFIYNK